jgi:hypothetical protein
MPNLPQGRRPLPAAQMVAFPASQLVIPGRAKGASPESITTELAGFILECGLTARGYGFRPFARPE